MSRPRYGEVGERMVLTNSVNLWSSTNYFNDEKQEANDDRYVMLLYTAKKNKKTIKKWREFKLPLELHRVETWAGLTDLQFHIVTTFRTCKQRGSDFATYKHHKVDIDGMYLLK